MKKIVVVFLFLTFGLSNYSYAESEKECFEKISRGIFNFNQGLDKTVIGPIARSYNKLPPPLKNGTANFTSNIGTLLSIPNQLLQGNLKGAGDSVGSFLINSTVGVLGFMDVASELGIKDTKEDVSQTLGKHGIGNGCYFVLPVMGPTTVRDSLSMIADTYVDPFATMTWRKKEVLNEVRNKRDYVGLKSVTAVDFRAKNDKNFESLEKNSIDLYAATKSLYLQNKLKKIKNSEGAQDDDWGDLEK